MVDRFVNRLRIILAAATALLLVALVAWGGLHPQMAPVDMPWHVAQAEWMMRHGRLLTTEVFSYPRLGAPVVNEYPLYHIVLWTVLRGGEWALSLACFAANGILLGLLFGEAWRTKISPALFGWAAFLATVLLMLRLGFRPELFTFLCFVFFMVFLLEKRDSTSAWDFWPLPLAQVLWVNSHSGFIIGPALVTAFAGEMWLRAALASRSWAWSTARVWLTVAAMVMLACFANPFGWERLALPFYHQGSEVIKAYVTEMQGLVLAWDNLQVVAMFAQLGILATGILLYRNVSLAFLAITLLFFGQTLESWRHGATFSLAVLGGLLSARAFGQPWAWMERLPWRAAEAAMLLVLAPLPLIPLAMVIGDASALSVRARWRDWLDGNTIYPREAVAWMKERRIEGKLLHRSEIGGYLQQQGFAGLTFADTGFGKYPPEFIREVGLISENPGYLATAIQRYQPAAIVLSSQSYLWLGALRQEGWRCVFYFPTGSVWLPPGSRPDLPGVTLPQIETAWQEWRATHDLPQVKAYAYWRILSLLSHGARELAGEELLARADDDLKTNIFWEAAVQAITLSPPLLESHAAQIDRMGAKASLSLPYRLTRLAQRQDWDAILALDLTDRPLTPSDAYLTLVAEALTKTGKPDEALGLLESYAKYFELRNGVRYRLMAMLYERQQQFELAEDAWYRAVYYHPDDAEIAAKAAAFERQHPSSRLRALLNSDS
jgi:hypothetical protein